jgi:hypothetical protein
MSAVGIKPAAGRHAHPGDFGAKLAEGKLWLPQEIVEPLGRFSVRTAEDLLAYLGAFPSAIAEALGWRLEEVERARESLVSALREHLDPALLERTPTFDPPLGAFDPSELPPDDD